MDTSRMNHDDASQTQDQAGRPKWHKMILPDDFLGKPRPINPTSEIGPREEAILLMSKIQRLLSEADFINSADVRLGDKGEIDLELESAPADPNAWNYLQVRLTLRFDD